MLHHHCYFTPMLAVLHCYTTAAAAGTLHLSDLYQLLPKETSRISACWSREERLSSRTGAQKLNKVTPRDGDFPLDDDNSEGMDTTGVRRV